MGPKTTLFEMVKVQQAMGSQCVLRALRLFQMTQLIYFLTRLKTKVFVGIRMLMMHA